LSVSYFSNADKMDVYVGKDPIAPQRTILVKDLMREVGGDD
jgi:hypothetical protein